jgi:hypothetical protein
MRTPSRNPSNKALGEVPLSPLTAFEGGKWHDPFIEDLHAVRARLLAKANGDMHQLVLNARQTAALHGFTS